MNSTARWLAALAVTALALPVAAATATEPKALTKAEQDKVMENTAKETREMPAQTKEQKAAAKKAKAAKMTPEQEKRIEMTGKESRDLGPAPKKTGEKRAVVPKEDLDKAKKSTPGG